MFIEEIQLFWVDIQEYDGDSSPTQFCEEVEMEYLYTIQCSIEINLTRFWMLRKSLAFFIFSKIEIF